VCEENDVLNLAYQDMVPITFSGVKELYTELKALKEEVVSLKARVADLEA
jgi:hypothetical protein